MALVDSLISFWELGEASGTRNDSHSTNHLTDNNTVTSGTGKSGDAAQFTAANSESLSRVSNASLQTGDIDFTFACWVYRDSAAAGMILAKDDPVSVNNRDYFLYIDSTLLELACFSSPSVFNYIEYTGTFGTSTWYFIVASHDAANDMFSISVDDGTPQTVASTGALQSPTTVGFRIGDRETSHVYFDGRIDQVGFWKRILTAPEQTFLYNSGNGRSYAEVVAGLPEPTGTTANPSYRLFPKPKIQADWITRVQL